MPRGSPAAELEAGTLFAERYEVVRTLGAGGMGIVYLAKDTQAGVELVLKLIHPALVTGEAAVKRLLAEGLTARSIRHPNIVAVYDVSVQRDQPYFTMEYVPGQTLRAWLVNHVRDQRDVPFDNAIGVIKALLAGLAEAHRVGVVHRDLKPENVMLVREPVDGQVELKILDFGIAKAIGLTRATHASGSGSGTPNYTAPEQMVSAEGVRPSADFYSVSVMLYELLMLGLPHVGRAEPPSQARPKEVPAALDAVIDRGLSNRAKSRFQSAAEYLAALDEALGSAKRPPQPPALPSVEPRPRIVPSPLPQSVISPPVAPTRPPSPPHPAAGTAMEHVRRRVEAAGFTWRGPGIAGGQAFDAIADKPTHFQEYLVLGRRVPTVTSETVRLFLDTCFQAADELLRPRFTLAMTMLGKTSIGCVPLISVPHLDPSTMSMLVSANRPFVRKLERSLVTVLIMPVFWDEHRQAVEFNGDHPLIPLIQWRLLHDEMASLCGTA